MNIPGRKDPFKFFTGNQRSALAKKNIFASVFISGSSIVIGLILLPLTINYLTAEKYGVWITLSSIIGWFSFFDIGLGNGLRNHFAQSLAEGKTELAKKYVSTTYAILSGIIVIVLLLFYFINYFLDWNKILNTSDGQFSVGELSNLALIVFTFFCLRFVFALISTILKADQQPAKASLLDLIGQFLSLVVIFILTRTTEGSIIYLGITISAVPVLTLIAANFFFYSKKYKPYRPDFKYIDFSQGRSLFNLGLKFFLIQIAAVLLYQTNNIVILQVSGATEVTYYNVVYRYFSVLIMGFSIIITPFWSAFTDAWHKSDLTWIHNIMKNLYKVFIVILVVSIIMLVFSNYIYHLWIGKDMNIPFVISFLVLIATLINIWNGIFSQFLNGVGKVRVQLIIGLAAAVINVPLSIFLGLKMGIQGVLIANIIVTIAGVIIYPLQYKKILNRSAVGVWGK